MPNATGKTADKKKDLDDAIAEADATLTKVKGNKAKMQATRIKKTAAAALLADFEEDFIWTVQEERTSTGTATGTTTSYVTLMISRTQPGTD